MASTPLRTIATPAPLAATAPLAGEPAYKIWSRRTGARLQCPKCKALYAPIHRSRGQIKKTTHCPECDVQLPKTRVFPPRAKRKWYVRVTQPDGSQKDHPQKSKEACVAFTRHHRLAWTQNPVRRELLDALTAQVHGIDAETVDAGIDELVARLGGDPASRNLKVVTWDEAVDAVLDQMGDRQLSEGHRKDTRRAIRNLQAISGVTRWCDLTFDDAMTFQSRRLAGGWKLEQPKRDKKSRKVGGTELVDQGAVGPRGVNKEITLLKAFCKRAVKRGFMTINPFDDVEQLKEKSTRPEYIPDIDLKAIIAAAKTSAHPWMYAMLVVKIFTGCRNQDIIALEWDRDVDLDGLRVIPDGIDRPKIYVAGEKADTGHWIPMHGDVKAALIEWKSHESQAMKIGPNRKVFPMPGTKVTTQKKFLCDAYREMCIGIGLWKWNDLPSGKREKACRWSLHDFRKLMTTNLRNSGLSAKERGELVGNTAAVNAKHYEALDAKRAIAAIESLPSLAG